jgi:hypothetical protein
MKILIFLIPTKSDSTVQYAVNVSAITGLKSYHGVSEFELTFAVLETGLKETDYASHKHDTGNHHGAMSTQRNPDLYFMLSPRQKDWQRLNMYRSCDKGHLAKNSSQYPDEMGGTAISKCMMCQFCEQPSSSMA